jgi:hypothetical protein
VALQLIAILPFFHLYAQQCIMTVTSPSPDYSLSARAPAPFFAFHAIHR